MGIDMSEFYQVFFEEASELLGEMEGLLVGLDITDPVAEDLNAIFRVAHSIKGGAGTFGFNDMTEVTHVLESLLDRIRKQELSLRAEMIDVFLRAGDVLRAQLAEHRGDGVADVAVTTEVCVSLKALAEDQPMALQPAAVEDAPESAGVAEIVATVIEENAQGVPADTAVPVQHKAVDEGAVRTMGEADDPFFASLYHALVGPAPVAGGGADESLPASSASTGPAGVSGDGGPVVADAPATTTVKSGQRESDKGGASAAGEAFSIRVNIEKVDQLINLVGELVITQAMLAQTASGVDLVLHEALSRGISQLERNSRDLQEAVMSIRMLPIGFVFSRFPRVVRELAAKLGKQAEIRTVGEATELDKGMIEKITDPLTHLVRNSLDHGIETPSKRLAAGKPEVGTVTLRAFHRGGSIIIEVGDDGAGLDRERILAKARERGLPAPDDMSDQEVWQLIFEPGFSTAETVTDVSGRGVGMDVVMRNIKALGGRVEIDSERNVGTRISICLPLTLAILDGMSVAVGSEIFIVPLTAIVESLQPAQADIRTVNRERLLHVRGEHLPLTTLHEVFGLKPAADGVERSIVVILEANGVRKAFFVDALLGQHQVVIKSLETNYRRIPGVSGATIMGDGRVALILDVGALVRIDGRRLLAAA